MTFRFEKFSPVTRGAAFADAAGTSADLIALDVQNKYAFFDEKGATYHEYYLPDNPDIYNCGGYLGKIVYYRDPEMLTHFQKHGVTPESLVADAFPILSTQSPKLDLILIELIEHLGRDTVSVLDFGCTVAEHHDLLDVMLRARSGGRRTADRDIVYHGVDQSSFLLSVARMMHADVPDDRFRLYRSEGSQFDFASGPYDLTFSVGVVNHIVGPMEGMKKLLAATRHAAVFQLWVTSAPEGVWAFNHSGIPFYFFSQSDLIALQTVYDGVFHVGEFTPQEANTQARSFIGFDEGKMAGVGSYQLVFSRLPELPASLAERFHLLTDLANG